MSRKNNTYLLSAKFFLRGGWVMGSLVNYFVRIHLIMCNLDRTETPPWTGFAACYGKCRV
jgi:hypothetical protein